MSAGAAQAASRACERTDVVAKQCFVLANQRDVGPQPVERGVVVERPASIDRNARVGHIVLHLEIILRVGLDALVGF